MHEYGIGLRTWDELPRAAALVAAVAHEAYFEMPLAQLTARLLPGGVFADVKASYDPQALAEAGATVWRL
jgi:UDP-N-acetyl-D-galactosamine dehydrogenase